MRRSLFLTALFLTAGQAGSQQFAGTWVAEFEGRTHVRLELRVTNGLLAGRVSLGDIEVNSEGVVRRAETAPKDMTPIFDIVVRDGVLSFSRKDGQNTDHFELGLAGDAAELRFLPSEADRKELAEIGVPVPKPIRLRRVVP